MKYWVNILHIYQPPTQEREVIEKVSDESYSLILRLLEKYSNLKITLNVSGSLVELLLKYGRKDIIDGIRKFAEEGRIELLGSAMYHPILPLLSRAEIERQIRLNETVLKEYFGDVYKTRGFYLPELAYSKRVAGVLKKLGFSYFILDETHALSLINPDIAYSLKGNGLSVIFRNTEFSKTFPPEYIYKNKDKVKSEHLVTLHDGELYGHWHRDDIGFYERIFTHTEIKTLTASEYLSSLSKKETIEVREANWESTKKELDEKIPFGLWDDPRNIIHKRLTLFKNFVLKIIKCAKLDSGYGKARNYADKGIASCAWWWASERKIGPFSPVSWNPTEIEKGARQLLLSVRSLQDIDEKKKLRAEKMFAGLHKIIWEKHWKDHKNG
ncbi:MAG: polysaccharide deacetylase family protein [Candidatus Pacebacteria bacterium]|nr:polysaccharide deacetylase family protein [Candidatus Paceibacterota bacterium]